MIALAARFEQGVADAIARHGLDWHVSRIGCRVEYLFSPEPPRTGAEGNDVFDAELDAYMHLYMLNRGHPDHAVPHDGDHVPGDRPSRTSTATRRSSARRPRSSPGLELGRFDPITKLWSQAQ